MPPSVIVMREILRPTTEQTLILPYTHAHTIKHEWLEGGYAPKLFNGQITAKTNNNKVMFFLVIFLGMKEYARDRSQISMNNVS